MGALDQEMVVERPEDGREGIGVDQFPGGGAIGRPQPIGRPTGHPRPGFDHALEEAGVVAPLQPGEDLALGVDHVEEFGMGHEGPHHRRGGGAVPAEDGEGVAVAPRDDRLDVGLSRLPLPVAHREPPFDGSAPPTGECRPFFSGTGARTRARGHRAAVSILRAQPETG